MSSAPRRTKRIPVVRSAAIAANDFVDLKLERGVVAFSLSVVDAATFAGVAWTLAYESDPATVRHLAAGVIYSEDHLRLAGITVRLGAAVAARAELVVWRT